MRARLCLSGGDDPRPFFADPERTVSLGDELVADRTGVFPRAFQDAETAFRLLLEGADGSLIGDIDPFYFAPIIEPLETR